MGVLQKILHFIGGKPPKVIFRDNELFHDHPAKKWDDWKARFTKPEYKWEEHQGAAWQPKKPKAPSA